MFIVHPTYFRYYHYFLLYKKTKIDNSPPPPQSVFIKYRDPNKKNTD